MRRRTASRPSRCCWSAPARRRTCSSARLGADRRAPYRVIGLLSLGRAQTGRRIGGLPILGNVAEAAAVLAGLRATGRLPGVLVVTEADLAGEQLAALMEVADHEGIRVARAPRPTALDSAAAAGRRGWNCGRSPSRTC